jgi:predicted GNAT family acetyltransferase
LPAQYFLAAKIMMRIHRYTDPQLFLDRCQEWLLKSELQNSTMLAVARILITGDHPFDPPYYFASIENGDDIVGCAVRAPPDSLLLANVPVDAIPLLATDIATVYKELPSVTGMATDASAFSRRWQKQRGESTTIINWKWYALEKVIVPKSPAPGVLRLAEASDLELIREWAPRFASETNTLFNVIGFYERRIRTESLYLWVDQEPRSMVAVSAKTPNSIRVSGVYTARDCRRNGYASTAVASVSQLMLDAGHQFCGLFADKSDLYANGMYQAIGFEPIFDNVNIRLVQALTDRR